MVTVSKEAPRANSWEGRGVQGNAPFTLVGPQMWKNGNGGVSAPPLIL